MDADALKLLCKACSIAVAKVYAKVYEVECLESDCETKYLNLLYLYELTGCTTTEDVRCQIQKVTRVLSDPDPFTSTGSSSCIITVTDVTDIVACTNPTITDVT